MKVYKLHKIMVTDDRIVHKAFFFRDARNKKIKGGERHESKRQTLRTINPTMAFSLCHVSNYKKLKEANMKEWLMVIMEGLPFLLLILAIFILYTSLADPGGASELGAFVLYIKKLLREALTWI